ncbi:MAG: HAD family hydrolase [Nitrospirae bacterium]|nr:HAD family hydrolase [Nitrospirota bacterium]MBI3594775.1 HAD family hydrolase [Nitrospirota bacterium]
MNRFKAVYFDLDGTLIDSFTAIQSGYNFALSQLNETIRLSLDQVKKRVGGGLKESFFDLVGEERSEQGVVHFRSKYKEVYLKETYLLPYVFHVVTSLSRKGVNLAVISNKYGDFSRDILTEFKLLPYLSAVVGDGDGYPLKPHTGMIDHLNRKFNLLPGDVLYIGDGPIDIECCRRAGVSIYAVTTGNYTRDELFPHHPERIIDTLEELLSDFS